MTTPHYNVSLAKDAARILNNKGLFVSNEVENLTPVVLIEPYANIQVSGSLTVTSNQTLYTVPTDKAFFLTGACFNHIANAACDNTSASLRVTPYEAASPIEFIIVGKFTLTAYNETVVRDLSTPILLKPGSLITINQTFTVGSAIIRATINGYTQEYTV